MSLDAPDDVISKAIPDFYDAAAHESEFTTDSHPAVAARLAALRPFAAEYEVLNLTRVGAEQAQRLLSPREQEVIRLLSDGHTVTQMADRLHIAPATVRTHLQRVYWKLGRAADRRVLGS